VHGKPDHEETRATFSHAAAHAPALILRDMNEAKQLAAFIIGKEPLEDFFPTFRNQFSQGFDPARDLARIGVVNQTTMLAEETQAIADFLKQTMTIQYSLNEKNISERFADTRDTLCYATNDNQTAVSGMLKTPADLAIVIGGYNSSNTTHLVELCESILPVYFIRDEEKILSKDQILHFDIHTRKEILNSKFLPAKSPVRILITSGASCPDALVEGVIEKLTGFFPGAASMEEMAGRFGIC
jgi:4-hydroxy-3-methylbut-2-en-1-yl diphosphate reductase